MYRPASAVGGPVISDQGPQKIIPVFRVFFFFLFEGFKGGPDALACTRQQVVLHVDALPSAPHEPIASHFGQVVGNMSLTAVQEARQLCWCEGPLLMEKHGDLQTVLAGEHRPCAWLHSEPLSAHSDQAGEVPAVACAAKKDDQPGGNRDLVDRWTF